MLIDTLNPQVIVIGSIFARQTELLWPAARQVIDAEALPLAAGVCRIVPAELGDSIGDYASLSVAAMADRDGMSLTTGSNKMETGYTQS